MADTDLDLARLEGRLPFRDEGVVTTIPGEWAEPFVRYVYAKSPGLFGDAIRHILGAEREDRRRRG